MKNFCESFLFCSSSGSRKEKAVEAVATIGPAVFNGGMTTFLALVLIGASTSHVFVTFFKVTDSIVFMTTSTDQCSV